MPPQLWAQLVCLIALLICYLVQVYRIVADDKKTGAGRALSLIFYTIFVAVGTWVNYMAGTYSLIF